MANKNPCDACDGCKEDCVFIVHTQQFQCHNYECFLNHEGSCLVSFYEHCGAWKEHEDGK